MKDATLDQNLVFFNQGNRRSYDLQIVGLEFPFSKGMIASNDTHSVIVYCLHDDCEQIRERN